MYLYSTPDHERPHQRRVRSRLDMISKYLSTLLVSISPPILSLTSTSLPFFPALILVGYLDLMISDHIISWRDPLPAFAAAIDYTPLPLFRVVNSNLIQKYTIL